MLFFLPRILFLVVLGSDATSSRKPSMVPQIKSTSHESPPPDCKLHEGRMVTGLPTAVRSHKHLLNARMRHGDNHQTSSDNTGPSGGNGALRAAGACGGL